jgi:hypothetical protein
MRAFALGTAALLFLVLLQGRVINLPFPAQRALSFLPGKWEYIAKAEAEASTEWRVTMWKAMLEGDRYIHNKWLGDGFGFTHREFEIMDANRGGSTADQQENLMISGGVHSGPVSTIKYVGYVGLVLFMIFLTLVAMRSARLIRRAQGTPFYSLALFICIPVVLYPLGFAFVFGAFDGDLPNSILLVGMQRMLENSIEAYEAKKEKSSSREIIQPPKIRPVRPLAPAGGMAR